jgi:hypothetical protein
MTADPWEVLGLPPGASLAEARAARRRLAKQLHPDVHGARPDAERAELERRMTVVNQALASLVAGDRSPSPGAHGPAGKGAAADHHPAAAAPGDDDTLTIEALPVRAFEALFVVAYGIGEILDDDEPYGLDLYLPIPSPCFCHVAVAPQAGGSIVTLSLAAPDEGLAPPVGPVRDLLVDELNVLAGRR